MLALVPVSVATAACPACGQRAPIVLEGMGARCTACGAARLPFSAKAVNLAGTPSRVGGIAAKVAGAAVLVMGSALALGLGLLAETLFPGGYAGLALGLPIGIITLALGLTLVLGGRKLSKSGDVAALRARQEAVRALAAHRRGRLTAVDAGRALGIDEAKADALLTSMARDGGEQVSLDVDDDGVVHYLFGTSIPLRFDVTDRPRVDGASTHAGERAAVDEAAVSDVEGPAVRRRSR